LLSSINILEFANISDLSVSGADIYLCLRLNVISLVDILLEFFLTQSLEWLDLTLVLA
jgi:hypothetical protein